MDITIEEFLRSFPHEGAVIATYRAVPPRFGEAVYGVDLRSGAWFSAGTSGVKGREADGRTYWGELGSVKYADPSKPLSNFGITQVCPWYVLWGLSPAARSNVNIERLDDGSMVVETRFPFGDPGMLGRTLPDGTQYPLTLTRTKYAPDFVAVEQSVEPAGQTPYTNVFVWERREGVPLALRSELPAGLVLATATPADPAVHTFTMESAIRIAGEVKYRVEEAGAKHSKGQNTEVAGDGSGARTNPGDNARSAGSGAGTVRSSAAEPVAAPDLYQPGWTALSWPVFMAGLAIVVLAGIVAWRRRA